MTCCDGVKHSRYKQQQIEAFCGMGNTRYKYLDMPPRTSALSLKLETLTNRAITWFTDDITLTIQRKGCGSEDCLVYQANTIDMDNCRVRFAFDNAFACLCAGRYEGIICVGCKELPCRLDFSIGQSVCVDEIEFESNTDKDARAESNPDCCETKTEQPQGCTNNLTDHRPCGPDIGADKEVCIEYAFSQAELEALSEWIDNNSGVIE